MWQWCMGPQSSAMFPGRYKQKVQIFLAHSNSFLAGVVARPTHRQRRNNRLFFLRSKNLYNVIVILAIKDKYTHIRNILSRKIYTCTTNIGEFGGWLFNHQIHKLKPYPIVLILQYIMIRELASCVQFSSALLLVVWYFCTGFDASHICNG